MHVYLIYTQETPALKNFQYLTCSVYNERHILLQRISISVKSNFDNPSICITYAGVYPSTDPPSIELGEGSLCVRSISIAFADTYAGATLSLPPPFP